MSKEYLGDGVYAERDERGVVLTTEDGISVTNTVVLESAVLDAFWGWLTSLKVTGGESL